VEEEEEEVQVKRKERRRNDLINYLLGCTLAGSCPGREVFKQIFTFEVPPL
jgi:hypothetical protein